MVTSIWRSTCSLASLTAVPRAETAAGVFQSKTLRKSSWPKYCSGSSPQRVISAWVMLVEAALRNDAPTL